MTDRNWSGWTVVLVPGSYQRPAFIKDRRGRFIASVHGDQMKPDGPSIGEAQEIAQLIAFAPEMLQALKNIVADREDGILRVEQVVETARRIVKAVAR